MASNNLANMILPVLSIQGRFRDLQVTYSIPAIASSIPLTI
jgi:hypothetical protein